MSSSRTSHSFASSQYINGVYIPSALLLVGIAIVKIDWLPHAALVALLLGSWKVYNNRELILCLSSFSKNENKLKKSS